MAIEIVDFPMKNGGSFQFAMLNYQRVFGGYTAWIISILILYLIHAAREAQEPL